MEYKITEYVLGFLFNQNKTEVVLIKKNRPDWQKGKLNGVGGHIKIDECETPINAIRREFEEEAGVDVIRWTVRVIMHGKDNNDNLWRVWCFFAFDKINNVKSITDEQIRIVPVNNLPENIIPSLRWIIPMCLDDDSSIFPPVHVWYSR